MHPVQIGPYRITGILGRGGMGVVYRATVVVSCEVPIGEEVAIKLLRDADASEGIRFTREAAYLQKLRHPNIVRVYDAGEYGGQPYIVMQLLKGRHVDALVANGRQLEQRRAAEIAVQGLDALVAAHRQGILHRDIKPGNLIIDDDGVVRLLDFGLAQLMVLESGLTATGAVVGTPSYMSPEQARGERERVGPRSDIYGMGACLYELVTGHPPHEADNPVAVLHRVVSCHLVSPRTWRPDIDRDLETILLCAMAKAPQDRYPSAEAMAEDLRRFLRGERIKIKRTALIARIFRKVWQERRGMATTGLGVFISLALVVLLVDIAITRHAPLPQTGSTPVSAGGKSAGSLDIPGGTTETTTLDNVESGATTEALSSSNQRWINAWKHESPLQGGLPEVKLKKFPGQERDMVYAALPAVTGPVRLTAWGTLGEGNIRIELLINDRDVGQGYRLRLEATGKTNRLTLAREGREILARVIPRLTRNVPLRLCLERRDLDDAIVATCEGVAPLEFLDPMPIEGLNSNAVYVAFSHQSTIYNVTLERKRGHSSVSALAPIDALRLDNKPAQAKNLYETFLLDNATSSQAREAELRIAMCDYELAKNDRNLDNHELVELVEGALERCEALASANRTDKRFVQAATFQAWLCALHVRKFPEAGDLLAALERDCPLSYLLAIAPQERVLELLRELQTRGEKLANEEIPMQAVQCFTRAEGIAIVLHRREDLRHIRHWRGDLQRSIRGDNETERLAAALEAYELIANDTRESAVERGWALLKSAETYRLMGETSQAIALYRAIIDTASYPVVLIQISRLWLGDIYAEADNSAEAFKIWQTGTETRSFPGRIMNNLQASRQTDYPAESGSYDNDIAYFNARLAALNADIPNVRSYLLDAQKRCPIRDWPSPLIQRWIERLDQSLTAPRRLPGPAIWDNGSGKDHDTAP